MHPAKWRGWRGRGDEGPITADGVETGFQPSLCTAECPVELGAGLFTNQGKGSHGAALGYFWGKGKRAGAFACCVRTQSHNKGKVFLFPAKAQVWTGGKIPKYPQDP